MTSKKVLQPANRIERFEKLHNDLSSLRKLLLCYRLIRFKDRLNDVDVGLSNRDKELGKPLLQLFYGYKSYDEIRNAVLSFLNKKNKRKSNTFVEPTLFEMVIVMMNKQKTLELSVSDIWEVMINPIRSDDGLPTISGVYNTSKPNEYQTQDYDTIYRNTFTKILENFGAEHEKRGNKRIMIFDPNKLTRVAKQYGFVLDMKTETGIDGNVSKLLYIVPIGATATAAIIPVTATANTKCVLFFDWVSCDNLIYRLKLIGWIRGVTHMIPHIFHVTLSNLFRNQL